MYRLTRLDLRFMLKQLDLWFSWIKLTFDLCQIDIYWHDSTFILDDSSNFWLGSIQLDYWLSSSWFDLWLWPNVMSSQYGLIVELIWLGLHVEMIHHELKVDVNRNLDMWTFFVLTNEEFHNLWDLKFLLFLENFNSIILVI